MLLLKGSHKLPNRWSSHIFESESEGESESECHNDRDNDRDNENKSDSGDQLEYEDSVDEDGYNEPHRSSPSYDDYDNDFEDGYEANDDFKNDPRYHEQKKLKNKYYSLKERIRKERVYDDGALENEDLDKRQVESGKRVKSLWQSIIDKYSAYDEYDQGDVINLETLSIESDRGHLMALNDQYMTDVWKENSSDEEDDDVDYDLDPLTDPINLINLTPKRKHENRLSRSTSATPSSFPKSHHAISREELIQRNAERQRYSPTKSNNHKYSSYNQTEADNGSAPPLAAVPQHSYSEQPLQSFLYQNLFVPQFARPFLPVQYGSNQQEIPSHITEIPSYIGEPQPEPQQHGIIVEPYDPYGVLGKKPKRVKRIEPPPSYIKPYGRKINKMRKLAKEAGLPDPFPSKKNSDNELYKPSSSLREPKLQIPLNPFSVLKSSKTHNLSTHKAFVELPQESSNSSITSDPETLTHKVYTDLSKNPLSLVSKSFQCPRKLKNLTDFTTNNKSPSSNQDDPLMLLTPSSKQRKESRGSDAQESPTRASNSALSLATSVSVRSIDSSKEIEPSKNTIINEIVEIPIRETSRQPVQEQFQSESSTPAEDGIEPTPTTQNEENLINPVQKPEDEPSLQQEPQSHEVNEKPVNYPELPPIESDYEGGMPSPEKEDDTTWVLEIITKKPINQESQLLSDSEYKLESQPEFESEYESAGEFEPKSKPVVEIFEPELDIQSTDLSKPSPIKPTYPSEPIPQKEEYISPPSPPVPTLSSSKPESIFRTTGLQAIQQQQNNPFIIPYAQSSSPDLPPLKLESDEKLVSFSEPIPLTSSSSPHLASSKEIELSLKPEIIEVLSESEPKDNNKLVSINNKSNEPTLKIPLIRFCDGINSKSKSSNTKSMEPKKPDEPKLKIPLIRFCDESKTEPTEPKLKIPLIRFSDELKRVDDAFSSPPSPCLSPLTELTVSEKGEIIEVLSGSDHENDRDFSGNAFGEKENPFRSPRIAVKSMPAVRFVNYSSNMPPSAQLPPTLSPEIPLTSFSPIKFIHVYPSKVPQPAQVHHKHPKYDTDVSPAIRLDLENLKCPQNRKSTTPPIYPSLLSLNAKGSRSVVQSRNHSRSNSRTPICSSSLTRDNDRKRSRYSRFSLTSDDAMCLLTPKKSKSCGV